MQLNVKKSQYAGTVTATPKHTFYDEFGAQPKHQPLSFLTFWLFY